MSAAAFYCVADSRYFLGAVALLNSLRLHGHREQMYLLDCGLERRQRELLEAHATVIPAPAELTNRPWLAKTVAPLAHPADVAVLIDVDMIATRPLAPLIERAGEDRIVAFENDRDRYFAEWGKLLDLGQLRRDRYVSSGLVLCGGATGARVLELLDDRQRRAEIERGLFGRDEPGYPFRYPEQDVLNAILMAKVEPGDRQVLPNRLAPNPPFAGVELADLAAVRCEYRDGDPPFVLHHFGRKPWLTPIYHGLYSRLMARLLLGPRIALRIPEEEVPLRFRRGARARGARLRADVADVFSRYVMRRPGA
ncbi:MAG TPA: hypothetical protein VFY99_03290 [Solirubrobacterales bacterium]